MMHYPRWVAAWVAVCGLAGHPAAAEPIFDLADPAQLFAQWPEADVAVGKSVRLPETTVFDWPVDRAMRQLVMDKAGSGGSLYTRGDFGGPVGHVGLSVAFVGGPERLSQPTPTVTYLGGDGPGQPTAGRMLRMNSLHFRHAACETGPGAAHRLVLQSDVELVFQEAASKWNPPHLRIYGGSDLDIRELSLAGHRLSLLGGTISVPKNNGVISYAGIAFGGACSNFRT